MREELKRYSAQEIDAVIPDKGIDARTKIRDKSLKATAIETDDSGSYFTGTDLETILQEIGEALSDGGLI